MADYYSILNKTIAGLNQNTPELRKAVYDKARAAIENQLRRLDPFPGEDAITRQLELLEEAVIVVEAEHSTPTAPVVSDDVPGSAAAPTSDRLGATPVASAVQSLAPAPVAPVAPPPTAGLPPQADVAPPPSAMTAPPQASMPDQPAPVFPPRTAPPEVANPEVSVDAPQVSPNRDFVGSGMADRGIADPGMVDPGMMRDPGMANAEMRSNLDAAGIPDEMISRVEQQKPKRGMAAILTPIIILALLASGAYAAWINRDAISDGMSNLAGLVQGEREAETGVASDDTADDKEEVRIDSNGTEPVEQPVQATPEPTVIPQQPADNNDVTVVEPVKEATPTETATDTAPTTPAPLGEVAYLYEEGSAGAGATRLNASVNWELTRESPNDTLPAEPVIVGKMEVPGRGLQVEMVVKRNVDEALSASHIIELKFEVPPDFTGSTIDNVARFVMKPTEEARGEQLVAVPVKVSDGFFLFALDNLEQAVRVNQQLMLSSAWIDVPLSYGSGKRALLTMEKGGSGQQVFEQAFTDWQRR